MNLQSVRDTITLHKDQLRQFGIRQIGIFGSLVTGKATADSDIDLLLDFEPEKKSYRNFYNGTELLEAILKHPIDAVTPQALSPHIKPYIDSEITYVQIAN